MGNDGGTIARGKGLKAIYTQNIGTQDQHYLQKSHNSKVVTCGVSSLPLHPNEPQAVVSDYKGKVFLKEKVLEYMLNERATGQDQHPINRGTGANLRHLKRLSDLVDLHVTWKDGMAVCPLSGTSSGLIYLRQCGCVVSAKMAADILAKTASDQPRSPGRAPKEAIFRACPSCGRGAEAIDVVYLNPPSGSDLEDFNVANYEALVSKGLTHSKTKSRKRKRIGCESEDQRVSGSKSSRIKESEDQRVSGSKSLRIKESQDQRVSGSKSSRIKESQDQRV